MKLLVHTHKIEKVIDEQVNEKEIDISQCEFEFDEEITDEFVKKAYFTLKNNTYEQLIIDNKCKFPSEVLEEKGMVEIGVTATLSENDEYIKRYNPSPVYFDTLLGSLKDEIQNTEPITPTDKEQVEQALNDGLQEIDNALADLQEKVDSGYFKGEKGDCNFATFEIDDEMNLVMNTTEDMLLDFEIDNNGYLNVII